MSIPTFSHHELTNLQGDLLAALKSNNTDGLVNFDSQFSQLVLDVEKAIPTNSLSVDELKAHYCFSHNLYIASTQAQQAHLVMDELHDSFSRKLNLLAPLTSNKPSAPAPPPSKEPVAQDNSCSSPSHTILKNWSQAHMTYLFPTQPQLQELASQTSSTETKVNSWFRNARSRSGWSKLYALKTHVDKDQEKLQLLIDEYQSLKRLKAPEEFKKLVAEHETYQLLDKIFRWFATTKEGKAHCTGNLSFRQGAARVLDSSKQRLPTLSAKTAGSSSTTSSSPTANSSASTSDSSSRTASTAPTSVAGSSVRSASRDTSSARASSSSSSRSLPFQLSSSRQHLQPLLPPLTVVARRSPLLALSNPTCNDRSTDLLASSSSSPIPPNSLFDPALFASSPPSVTSSTANPTCTSRPADSQNSRSRSSSTTSLSTPINPTINTAAEPASSSTKPMMYHWVNPLNPCMRISSTSKSFKNSFINYISPPTVPSSRSSSKSSSPGSWTSPVISPLVSPVVQTSDLPHNPFLGFCPKPLPTSITILSSSSSDSILDRPSSSHPSICSSFSKEPAQSTLSGQFEDAPEQS
ncbi:uncharacterized protein PGTG_05144 [Puccinia graminis f. sp. tritici CRL 75-36-700-3]|uniref:Homeobox domain-containing protein n=1 Tax=Puccinia graminis f. sp. tritici (strain CRL 75-36-700-3 / race SCCL) TaxID=418459 RepID=E3K6R9_PUCGT|nr:uncharacterized protein PGTG_05144 [Puccinia graminis f. sp. tritici CRL 75-36-700-3]EFP79919.2 hypothetical protein PGTG_05144 [Puccinia graminis f. sp. tritici CRL 75-36-700-3]